MDPNRGDISGLFQQHQSQQNVWAEELRRADERALKFKSDLVEADQKRVELDRHIKELERAILVRDQEILRLATLYQGGQNFDTVKVAFDKQTADTEIKNLQNQREFLN